MIRYIRALGLALAVTLLALSLAPIAHAGTLTIQPAVEAGLSPVFAAASVGGDTFQNVRGDVVLVLRNDSTAAITVTVAAVVSTRNDANRGTLTKTDATASVPKKACVAGANLGNSCVADSDCPSSKCAAGLAVLGPFHPLSFNDATSRATATYSTATGLGVAAVQVPK